jgi:hypothetical protein
MILYIVHFLSLLALHAEGHALWASRSAGEPGRLGRTWQLSQARAGEREPGRHGMVYWIIGVYRQRARFTNCGFLV